MNAISTLEFEVIQALALSAEAAAVVQVNGQPDLALLKFIQRVNDEIEHITQDNLAGQTAEFRRQNMARALTWLASELGRFKVSLTSPISTLPSAEKLQQLSQQIGSFRTLDSHSA